MAKRIAPHNRDIIGFLEKCHHFEWNIITNSSTFFSWNMRQMYSNGKHSMAGNLTTISAGGSLRMRCRIRNSFKSRTDDKFMRTIFYRVQNFLFIFFFCEQHQHARSFNFFFILPPVALIVGLSVKIILKWAWHNCKENTDKPWTMQYYALLS